MENSFVIGSEFHYSIPMDFSDNLTLQKLNDYATGLFGAEELTLEGDHSDLGSLKIKFRKTD